MSALEGMSAPARMSPPHAPSLLAVAWDIDGTLIDSEPVHLLALQSVCRDHRVAIDDLPDTHFIGVHVDDVNIKAKTAEKLGFVGRGEGIVAEVVALISQAVTATGRIVD